MKRNAVIVALLLGVLCWIVPYSSRKPDAVQTVVGQPGGVETHLKAAGGILITLSVIYLLGDVLGRLKSKKRE